MFILGYQPIRILGCGYVTSAGETYAVTAGSSVIVNNLLVQNTGTASSTFSFGIISAGGTMDAGTTMLKQTVSVGGFLGVDMAQVARAGESVTIKCDVASTLVSSVYGQVVT